MSEPFFGPRQAQSLTDILALVGDTGWDVLEQSGVSPGMQPNELDERTKAIAPLLYRLVREDAGREFFEWLCDLTVRRPNYVPGQTIEQAALYAAMRHGQDGVLHTILKAVHLGQTMVEDGTAQRTRRG